MRTILLNVLVGLAYYLGAELGLQLALVNDQVTPLWPPTGIALAALMTYGLRMWPGIAVAAFAINMPLGELLPTATITVGNVLAPLAAAWYLKYRNFRMELDRVRDALHLIFPAALGCMMISATFGATSLVASPALGMEDFWSTWAVWWTGDAMGILVVAPTLMMLRRIPQWPMNIRTTFRFSEATALVLCTAVITLSATFGTTHLVTFVVAPFIIWAALRFTLFGAAPIALMVSVIAIWGVEHNGGPFQEHSVVEQMVMLQTFIGSVAIVALLLSAVIEERNAAELQTVRANRDLCKIVNHLTHVKTACMVEVCFNGVIQSVEYPEVIGWEKGALPGKQLETIIPERYRAAHRAGFERFKESGESRVAGATLTVPVLSQDGREAAFTLTVAKLGEFFLGTLVPVRDIGDFTYPNTEKEPNGA